MAWTGTHLIVKQFNYFSEVYFKKYSDNNSVISFVLVNKRE